MPVQPMQHNMTLTTDRTRKYCQHKDKSSKPTQLSLNLRILPLEVLPNLSFDLFKDNKLVTNMR